MRVCRLGGQSIMQDETLDPREQRERVAKAIAHIDSLVPPLQPGEWRSSPWWHEELQAIRDTLTGEAEVNS